jgi:hypothetical protein
LRGSYQPTDSIKFFSEGWVSSWASLNGVANNQADLREAWASWQNDNWEVKVGRQIIVWGRADRINPTDQISSINYTLMFIEDDDQRLGNFMAQVNYHVGTNGLVEAFWLPEYRANVPSLPIPTGFSVSTRNQEYWDCNQGALRFDDSGGAVDWSVSYFHGLDRNLDLALLSPSVIVEQHNPINSVGADAATTVGNLDLRAEGVYTRTANFTGTDPTIKHSFAEIVAGGDVDLTQDLNFNLQGVYMHVFNFLPMASYGGITAQRLASYNAILSGQTDENKAGLAARVAWQDQDGSLATEASILYFPEQQQYIVKAQLSYEFRDDLWGYLGGDLIGGQSVSTFGVIKETSLAYVGVRVGY